MLVYESRTKSEKETYCGDSPWECEWVTQGGSGTD